MKSKWFMHEIRVRYQETDQMGIVYHTNYANWLEWGRTELIREAGMPYRFIENRGLRLPLLSLLVNYKLPAAYDDQLVICTRISEVSPVKLSFEYEIRRESDIIITGSTKHVWLNSELKPVRVDKQHPELYKLIQSLLTERDN
jgi:acyl-CoA thioester hydrolase